MVGLAVIGVVLLFTGHPLLGIAMLLAGGALGVAVGNASNGISILDWIKTEWRKVTTWWNTSVKKYFTLSWWSNLLSTTIGAAIQSFASKVRLPQIHFEYQQISPDNFLNKVFGITAFPVIRFYANGGFPEDGLFMANHGEMIGKFSNGKTAVANNEQITQGIARAVYDAFTSAMGDGRGDDKPIVIMLDGKEVARSTTKYQRQLARAGGV